MTKTKIFNGKTYTHVEATQNKCDAKRVASNAREDEYGSMARVTRRRSGVDTMWDVWVRQGGK